MQNKQALPASFMKLMAALEEEGARVEVSRNVEEFPVVLALADSSDEAPCRP